MVKILQDILQWIYNFTGSYGLAVIIFTILIRLVLTPLEVKSRKGMRRMTVIQPKLNELQKKYANDKAKLQQKQSELMKKEHYNPLSGCLPLLIQWPVLFCMFYAMRNIANRELAEQVFTFLQGEAPLYEGFLWVKNIFMADSPFKTIAADVSSMMAVGDKVWLTAFNNLSEGQVAVMADQIRAALNLDASMPADQILNFLSKEGFQTTINTYIVPTLQKMPLYVEQTAAVSGWKDVSFIIFKVTLYKDWNGLLILPILSGVSQVFMTKLNPATAQQPAANSKGQGAGMNAVMKYFFPIFSVWICMSSNAGFALYWVTINIFATAQSIVINKYLENKDAQRAPAAGEGSIK